MTGPAEAGSTSLDRVSVIVCRGCCCGTDRRHPEVDHVAQVERLAAAVSTGGRFWTVDCVGPCERANVVIVRTRAAGRRWFGGVLDAADTERLAGWIADGAPSPLPAGLARLEFAPADAATDATATATATD